MFHKSNEDSIQLNIHEPYTTLLMRNKMRHKRFKIQSHRMHWGAINLMRFFYPKRNKKKSKFAWWWYIVTSVWNNQSTIDWPFSIFLVSWLHHHSLIFACEGMPTKSPLHMHHNIQIVCSDLLLCYDTKAVDSDVWYTFHTVAFIYFHFFAFRCEKFLRIFLILSFEMFAVSTSVMIYYIKTWSRACSCFA